MPDISVLHILPSFGIGGSQRRVAALVDGLGVEFSHTIVALDGDVTAAKFIANSDRVKFLPFSLAASSGLNVGNLFRLRQLFRSARPDISISYNWGAIEATIANRIFKCCPQLHCEDGFTEHAEPRRRAWARRFAIGPDCKLISPSCALAEVAGNYWHIPKGRIAYVPNGIETGKFEAARRAIIHDQNSSGDEVVIGTVARLSPEKNISRLLRIFKSVSRQMKARLIIVGGGPDEENLRGMVNGMGLADQIVFTGPLEDVASALATFDIFALTSDTEQMPFSILEAMASGLPIVATDVGDLRDMLPPENADWLVGADDEVLFEEKVMRLCRSAEIRSSVGEINLQYVKNAFGQAGMVDCYRRLLLNSDGTN